MIALLPQKKQVLIVSLKQQPFNQGFLHAGMGGGFSHAGMGGFSHAGMGGFSHAGMAIINQCTFIRSVIAGFYII